MNTYIFIMSESFKKTTKTSLSEMVDTIKLIEYEGSSHL